MIQGHLWEITVESICDFKRAGICFIIIEEDCDITLSEIKFLIPFQVFFKLFR